VLDLPDETYLDMVRPGIMIYGLYPSAEVKHTIELKPAMSLRTEVAFVKRVPEDFCVSYGCTYRTPRETTLATLPLGYADGVSRLLSNNHEVLINGERHPLVGRITMDQVVIDVGDAIVEEGDEAVIFGKQGEGFVSADEVASRVGTINYEITCMVSRRVPRVYVKGGRWVMERGQAVERPL
jgi:alanine racemase